MVQDLKIAITKAQQGNENQINQIIETFQPLIYKNSIIDGKFDEDCYQELLIVLLKSIKSFKFNINYDDLENLMEALNREIRA